nr:PREDICTED: adenomatous polyposis coli homolog isoform X3 [Bemisia tabaci]
MHGNRSVPLMTSESSMYSPSHYSPDRSMEVMSESNEILAKILSWMNKDQVCSPDINKTDGCQNVSEVILNDNFPPNRPSLNFNMWRSVGPVSADSPKFDETIEKRSHSSQQLGTKVEMVYNLLSMLSTHDREKMTKTLLLMTNSPDSCMAMRKSGCLPLLVQLLHGADESPTVKEGAAQALRNIVHSNSDEKQGRREARVLRLLEQVRDYYEKLPSNVPPDPEQQDDNHIGQVVAALMKFSFDEEHRHAMCQLGALQTISKLILVDHKVHGSNTVNQHSITLRRFAGMTMTNLTFGDSANKSLVCSMSSFMAALVSQLESPSEDLRQVTASVLRNLSWRADERSKIALREVNAITALVKAAMRAEKESTLKSILSALWNFSTHSQENKADICAVEGCLQYLVKMLTYQAPSKTLSINENAGGILRNVSCQIAVREDYRQILRENNCLATLLQLLRSPSLAVVSNACCTLWNFSAQSEKDQQLLWDLGAVPLLRSLVNSKHKMISLGSSATLKNLLAARPDWDPFNKANKGMPGLSIRKRKAFEQELDVNLADTCDNIEVDEERWDGNVTATKSTPSAGQYAETDLDQPTNYSLRYAEDDSSEKIVDQEVPRTYCTEGTPCNISSATSVTDLRPSATDGKGIDEEKEVCTHTSPAESLHSIPNHPESQTPNDINDGKNMIMETPLMFSRASSLDSVSTPPDHPDDRSSVVSEFSRITSGMISPSELPDSPTQTIPPSPQSLKPPTSIPSLLPKPISHSVFEDTVASFKDENTPIQFSTATSLSSLTFDDDIKGDKLINYAVPSGNEKELAPVSEEEDDEDLLKACIRSGMPNSNSNHHLSDHLRRAKSNSPAQIPPSPQSLKSAASLNTSDIQPIQRSVFEDTVATFKDENTPVQFSSATSLSSLTFEDEIKNEKGLNMPSNISAEKDLTPVSEEEDEEALQACIKSGMPSRSSSSNQIHNSGSKIVLVKPCQRVAAKLSNVPIRTGLKKPVSMPAMADCEDDSVRTFCTEDTPANISHAASHSDLSMLCASSDDGSDYENILAECIQSGMPQSQRRVEPSPESKYTSPKHKTMFNERKIPELSPSNRQTSNSFNSPRALPLPRAIVHPRELREVAAQDEIECFATEGSPCNFSAWSSLSDLTVNSKNEQPRPVSSPVPNNESPPMQSLEHTDKDEITVITKKLSECQMKDSCDTWNDDSAITKPTEFSMKESCGTWNEDSTSLPSFNSPLINKSMEGKEVINVTEPTINTTEEQENKQPIATITPFIENREYNEEILSDSHVIELEAGKITIISSLDMEHSMSSIDLESVKPPSIMSSSFSMTSSITENGSLGKSNKMRSLLFRRALGDSVSCNIESTKPPSFLEEANLVDLENSIVSVASIVSEVVDSPPLSLTEDLTVTDTFMTCNDMTDSSTSGGITPKQKRSGERDRYNTYTIQPDKSREGSVEPGVKESQNEAAKKITPKQRRQTEKDRFLTRTIGDGDFIDNKNETPHVIANLDSKLSPKQKRSANKDRYLTRTLSRDNSLGSDTLIPIDNDILDPDTVTNISDYESEEEQVVNVPKPSIAKPVKTEAIKSAETNKSTETKNNKKSGIPTFKNKTTPKIQTTESPSKPPSTGSRVSPKTPPVDAGSRTQKIQPPEPASKIVKSQVKKEITTTNAVRPTKLLQPLQRQGTFTKDKPVTPVSGIPVLSPKTASAKKIPTKIASLRSPT